MKKIYQIASLVIFLLLISLPLIRHLHRGDRKLSNENRMFSQRPVFSLKDNSLISLTQKYDNYFADQFGYRELFIKTANQIRYKLFKQVISKQLTVGKNEFIFLNSHSAKYPNSFINEICDIKPLSHQSEQRIPRIISEFINHFNRVGIQTYWAIIPTKSRFYPKNLPKPLSSLCLKHTATTLDKILNNMNNPYVYYPLKKMQQWKKEFPLYLPKHFHWNGQLPYKIADDMMQNLMHLLPDMNITPEKTIVESDLNHHLQGLKFSESSIKYNYKKIGIKECRGKTCTDVLPKLYKNGNSFSFTRSNATTHRNLLLITDSFGAEVAEHFIRGFDEVTMVNTNNLTNQEQKVFFESIIKHIKPTHMIYLIHDGGVNWRTIKLEKNLFP
jgi:hypothetical protein